MQGHTHVPVEHHVFHRSFHSNNTSNTKNKHRRLHRCGSNETKGISWVNLDISFYDLDAVVINCCSDVCFFLQKEKVQWYKQNKSTNVSKEQQEQKTKFERTTFNVR